MRVLFVSDLHLNPAAWDVIRSVTKQFDVDVIVDAGDISDHGTAPENAYVEPIATLGRALRLGARQPRLGGHPGARSRAQPNAVVLDGTTGGGRAGCGSSALGDPRFTPDKDTRDEEAPPSVSQVGLAMAAGCPGAGGGRRAGRRAVVHDGAAAAEMDGTVPLVLSGHYHRREQHLLPERDAVRSSRARPARPGCAGWRGEKPTPVQRLGALLRPRRPGPLQAWDDITLGGLGLVSAKIERRIVAAAVPELAPTSPVAVGSSPTPSTLSRRPAGRRDLGCFGEGRRRPLCFRGSPTARTPWAHRPHRLVAQDAALSRR